ncbi:glycosyltransferase family 2 protein [Aurantiacibacter hainanensis]|uniref:glycosyltransferase family 2 protein n=1 Tax=Aurantiacibacter hainanensis TaxID=3076114 RepID=UPI0030C69F33
MMPLITFVLPFYNEEAYLPATLASLAAQDDRRFALRLVDNGSTDESAAIVRHATERMGDIRVECLEERRPGKLFALASGCRGIETPFIGTLDADTIYPPGYVGTILDEFARDERAAAVLALHDDFSRPGKAGLVKWLQIALRPAHCHSGGWGQAFRRDAFEEVGGFDPARWPFVLENHEIVHQVARFGPIRYRRDHVIRTSDRRSERTSVGWTLGERLAYKVVPGRAGSWFFHRVLAPRFSRRGLDTTALRAGEWRDQPLSK